MRNGVNTAHLRMDNILARHVLDNVEDSSVVTHRCKPGTAFFQPTTRLDPAQ